MSSAIWTSLKFCRLLIGNKFDRVSFSKMYICKYLILCEVVVAVRSLIVFRSNMSLFKVLTVFFHSFYFQLFLGAFKSAFLFDLYA